MPRSSISIYFQVAQPTNTSLLFGLMFNETSRNELVYSLPGTAPLLCDVRPAMHGGWFWAVRVYPKTLVYPVMCTLGPCMHRLLSYRFLILSASI